MLIRARFIQGDSVLAETVHFPSKPKNLKLTNPRIQTTVESTPSGKRITLETDVLASGVMLEFENAEGHFSDNYFHLLPGEKKTVEFSTSAGVPGELKIRSYLPAGN
jgi:beta-mannosidase